LARFFPGMTRAAVVLTALVAMAAVACGGEEPDPALDHVVFMAGFKAQANLPFVAAYVAQEKGYFETQGLDVEIRHASSGEHLKLLLSGDVDITTAAATSVLKRRSDPEIPVVAFVLFGQRGQQAYVSLSDSGMSTPDDWEGKTFGYKISVPPDYLAVLKSSGVDRSLITEVNAGFDPRILTEGRVDVLAVFNSNEPDTIRRLGFEVTTWEPEDFGVPNLGLTYIATEQTAGERGDLVQRFLKATLKGVEFAVANVEETLDIVLEYAPGADRDHQRFMLETELADARSDLTGQNGIGWMTDGQWMALYDYLLDFDALPNPFDYKEAFTDRFLRRVYDEGELSWP
jgi:ABC-type nitrate/sulfonate/bicarbonate transport system substrate-binding protein